MLQERVLTEQWVAQRWQEMRQQEAVIYDVQQVRLVPILAPTSASCPGKQFTVLINLTPRALPAIPAQKGD